MNVLESRYAVVVSILVITAVTFYTYLKWKYTYWKRHHFPFLEPRMPFGNLENPFTRKTAAAVELKVFYDELRSMGVKHGGIYSFFTPVYIPIDLEYIKNILSKDFQYFVERGRYYNEEGDPLSAHLFNIGGTKWRNLRTKFTPTFTSGKMKTMFSTLLDCGELLKKAVESSRLNNEPIEIKDLATKFTTEVIGSCVFGINCNSFSNNDSDFPKYGKMMAKGSLFEAACMAFTFSFPEFSKRLNIRRIDKRATDFFLKVIKDSVSFRESNNVRRNDFLQILIDLKNNVDSNEFGVNDAQQRGNNLTIEQIAAQSVVFFFAGFDTSATTITFALFELASNPEIQQKVRDEIHQVMSKYEGNLTYEALKDLKYMQQVIDETLRKYPPVPLLNRQCVNTYKIPNSDLTLEKGTHVIIPLLGLHRDPEHYPDPDKFDPERFSTENKSRRDQFSYLPFGEGPRSCIAFRFGLMQVKTGLCMLLRNYEYSLNAKTRVPLEMALSVMCRSKGGIWLDVTKID